MSEYRVYVMREPWLLQDVVRVYMQRKAGPTYEYLREDGTWEAIAGAEVVPEKAGILLPAAAIEPLTVAIQEFQGHTSHADTEARVLREWLAVEQRRVDAALSSVTSKDVR